MLGQLRRHFGDTNLDDVVGAARAVLPHKTDSELIGDRFEYAVARVEDDCRLGFQAGGFERAVNNALGGRLLGAKYQTMGHKVSAAHFLGGCERVAWMCDGNNALVQTNLAPKAAVVKHVWKHDDSDSLMYLRIDELGPAPQFDADLHVRKAMLKARDEYHPGHRVAQTNTEFAAFQLLMLP